MEHDDPILGGIGLLRFGSREVRERLEATPESVVVCSGSLIEGLGNSESDLDVYVIANERPVLTAEIESRHQWISTEDLDWYPKIGAPVCQTFDYMSTGRIGIDVNYFTFDEIAPLLSGLSEMFPVIARMFDEPPGDLSSLDLNLAHRLSIALPLAGERRFRDLMAGFCHKKFRYLRYRSALPGWDAFKDIIGAWNDADLETCVIVVQDYLRAVFAGFLCLNDLTNPNPKWIYRLASRLPDDHRDIAAGFLELSFGDRGSQSRKRRFVGDALALVDRVESRSRAILNAEDVFPSCDILLTRARARMARGFADHPAGCVEATWWINQHRMDAVSNASFLTPSPRQPAR